MNEEQIDLFGQPHSLRRKMPSSFHVIAPRRHKILSTSLNDENLLYYKILQNKLETCFQLYGQQQHAATNPIESSKTITPEFLRVVSKATSLFLKRIIEQSINAAHFREEDQIFSKQKENSSNQLIIQHHEEIDKERQKKATDDENDYHVNNETSSSTTRKLFNVVVGSTPYEPKLVTIQDIKVALDDIPETSTFQAKKSISNRYF
eukprot:CAMPEP_0117424854 /NCGR_PEP_ID=MMETSP0758-20121206/5212_1 /TAXON_ID=63605 /ORGANISM="Percolomonas cosmopolitus, Strain AE-1 (ATCC 50343)" /LENGTH=205 /DNA_ID=CAMNT_0005208927 /DNA_START=309 /DNA_END=923 /DNA_ORIENTATION=+